MCQPIKIDSNKPAEAFSYTKAQKGILVAISALMALGMVLSYAVGAPWLVILGFFLLSLTPLFPLGKAVDDQRSRFIG